MMEYRGTTITKTWGDETLGLPLSGMKPSFQFRSAYLDDYWLLPAPEPSLQSYKRLLTGDWNAPEDETVDEENERLKRLIKNLSGRIDSLQATEKLHKAAAAVRSDLTKDQAVRLKDLLVAARAWCEAVEGKPMPWAGARQLAKELRESVSEVETYVFPDGIGPVEAVQRMRQILADTA